METVHITTGSSKMLGLQSINTPTTSNEFCTKLASAEGSICSGCYAARYEKIRPSVARATARNLFMTQRALTARETPTINASIFRFHSYGELHNAQHLLNYIAIANHNPDTIFTLWTKRTPIVNAVFDNQLASKPSNLILVHSTLGMDSTGQRLPRYFDKVFSVFTKKGAVATSVDINCHSSCNECRLCYTHNDVTHINEIKK